MIDKFVSKLQKKNSLIEKKTKIKKPEISILIPAKNEEKYISDCLASIKKQTFQNWEAIIVDDHSTDETLKIVKVFQQDDARFIALKNEGKGIIHALRKAFANAQGNYITRMDADDLMRINKLETLYNGIKKWGRGYVAVGGVHYFAEEKLKSGFIQYEKWLNEHTKKGSNFTDIFKECAIPSPAWMLAKEDLIKINGFNGNRYPEDYDLAFRMYEAGIKVVPSDEIVHEWRDYDSRTSRTMKEYQEYTFTDIKWYYFEKLHLDKKKQLVVMGTGYRGKKLATLLLKKRIDFLWISNNKEKINKHIYDHLILDLSVDIDWKNCQVISTIANEKGKKYIARFFTERNPNAEDDLFHFC